ncbi:UNVERIFIED_CONTAM: Retrovirus-related Pol polyprotein from transposon [Sesamum radiatum]|uniref:Retrovirus-related Pol polyprotein from transposon n=1 Tax=Sesamum radiatum TaxID=300843 RepID=A0AAW2VP35_SESRA
MSLWWCTLDDIVIYSRTLAEHVEHLRQVLARLREYELYAKVSKCSFAQETISFLGHIVERGCIRMDPKKVLALISRPGKLLSAFCERLLQDSTAHDGLIEEDGSLELDTPMPSIFRRLEESDGDRPCVGLTRYVEPFVVETDASDFALGGVLMQDGHPVAFESRS